MVNDTGALINALNDIRRRTVNIVDELEALLHDPLIPFLRDRLAGAGPVPATLKAIAPDHAAETLTKQREAAMDALVAAIGSLASAVSTVRAVERRVGRDVPLTPTGRG